ncbi:hypothetical protein NTGBS_290006 [Candidatus Nitrotoga sp. BS]|nr:hypothetical protein NTGBS_290006 [Candidatus Nitrotoga sp. BS]
MNLQGDKLMLTFSLSTDHSKTLIFFKIYNLVSLLAQIIETYVLTIKSGQIRGQAIFIKDSEMWIVSPACIVIRTGRRL